MSAGLTSIKEIPKVIQAQQNLENKKIEYQGTLESIQYLEKLISNTNQEIANAENQLRSNGC